MTLCRARLALALLGLALLAAPGAALVAAPVESSLPDSVAPQSDVAALSRLWSGVSDLTEQVFFDSAPELTRPPGSQLRLQVQVTPVELPWLAPAVLYLEERPFDEPGAPRRQVLLGLTAGQQPGTVRVQQYTLQRPALWVDLANRPDALRRLTVADIDAHPGCDLQLVREAGQFRGGTLARACRDRAKDQYVDYQVLLGEDLYWYRQRTLALADDDLRREIAGFTMVDVENARLFTCQVRWRATAQAATLLLSIDLHDQGGRGSFTTPDGRRWRVTLYGRDWPFANGLDALQLQLEGQQPDRELASSWTASPGRAITLDYDKLSLHCAPVLPETDDVPS